MPPPRQPDHGSFTIQTSLNDDLKVIRESMQKAPANPSKPGHNRHWIVANPPGIHGLIAIMKMFHVDVTARIVVITEIRDGVETARQTFDLMRFG